MNNYARGAIMGALCGDACGSPLEFMKRYDQSYIDLAMALKLQGVVPEATVTDDGDIVIHNSTTH